MTPTRFSAPGAGVRLAPGNWKRRFDAASEAELDLHLVAQIRRKLAQKRARGGKAHPAATRAHATSDNSRGETMSNHVSALRAKHDQLDRGLIFELSRPLPDEQRVKALKLAKLRLKDRIVKLTPYPPTQQ